MKTYIYWKAHLRQEEQPLSMVSNYWTTFTVLAPYIATHTQRESDHISMNIW